MKITLNGQVVELSQHKSLNGIVELYCKDNPHVIAELNGEIIKNHHWNEQSIKEGDRLELVTFVGGGSL